MGFRPPAISHKLEWPDDNPLHGLTVRCGSVSVDEYNQILRLMYGDGPPPRPADVCTAEQKPCGRCDECRKVAEQIAGLAAQSLHNGEALLDKFAAALREWDYEHPITGEALPATREGVGRADATHMAWIIAAWTGQLGSVPPPLPKPSPNGNSPSDSEERALALASTSRNQSN
jgi:hypothetical protein